MLATCYHPLEFNFSLDPPCVRPHAVMEALLFMTLGTLGTLSNHLITVLPHCPHGIPTTFGFRFRFRAPLQG